MSVIKPWEKNAIFIRELRVLFKKNLYIWMGLNQRILIYARVCWHRWLHVHIWFLLYSHKLFVIHFDMLNVFFLKYVRVLFIKTRINNSYAFYSLVFRYPSGALTDCNDGMKIAWEWTLSNIQLYTMIYRLH